MKSLHAMLSDAAETVRRLERENAALKCQLKIACAEAEALAPRERRIAYRAGYFAGYRTGAEGRRCEERPELRARGENRRLMEVG